MVHTADTVTRAMRAERYYRLTGKTLPVTPNWKKNAWVWGFFALMLTPILISIWS